MTLVDTVPWALESWALPAKAAVWLALGGPARHADAIEYSGDLTRLPYPDETFWGVEVSKADLTIQLVAECLRVLRPLGVVEMGPGHRQVKPFRLIEWGKT